MFRAIIFVVCFIALAPPGASSAGDPLPFPQPEATATHRLTLQLREGDFAPVAARVTVLNPVTGAPFWPEDPTVPVYQTYTGQDFFYADGEINVTVDSGWVRVVATRGPEYNVVSQDLYVVRNLTRAVAFTRLFDPSAYGFYSGDVHVHIAHGGVGAVYTITNQDLARVVRAEGVNVTCALTNGLYFTGGPDPAGDADHLIYFSEEYRSALYGHMSVFGLTSLLSQEACCLPGYLPLPLNIDILDEAHAQGATVTYAHPVTMDPALMGNTSGDWPYSGFPREAPVDVLLGKVDAYDLFSYSNYNQDASRTLWFDLLNLGRRLPLSVGTDAAINRYFDRPLGGYRLYVKTPAGLDFDDWRAGLEAGHSFATNGPLILECTIDGVGPGETLSLPAEGGAPLSGHLLLQSRTPATQLEVFSDGKRVLLENLPAYSGTLAHDFTVARPEVSGWLVVRVSGPKGSPVDMGTVLEAVTSPIRVMRGNRPMEPTASAVVRFGDWIDDLQAIMMARDGWESPQQAALAWNRIEDAQELIAVRGSADGKPPVHDHFELLDQVRVTLAARADGSLFGVAGEGEGVLEVFDVQGRLVHVSAPRRLPAEFLWRDDVEGRDLASGLYFARVRIAESASRTYRLRLVR